MSFLISVIVPIIISPILISAIVRLVLELHELAEAMSDQASTDFLTNIPNRREFIKRIEEKLNLCIRNSLNFSLLYVDIDQFKAVNDTFGHAAGDDILNQIGPILQQHTRSSDTIGRIGGDEFAIALVGLSAAESMIVAEKIRTYVDQSSFYGEAEGINITTSIGIVCAEAPALSSNDLDSLIKTADKALYQAKHDGRNCTRIQTLHGPKVILGG